MDEKKLAVENENAGWTTAAQLKTWAYSQLPTANKIEILSMLHGTAYADDPRKIDRGLLPPGYDSNKEYYFVSYAHEDYLDVYRDIYALQELGLNLWYDGGGLTQSAEDWRAVAERYIRPSQCLGVIFYISETSVMKEAIHEEIKTIKTYGKPCMTVNLQIKGDFVDCEHKMRGKIVSAGELLSIMKANGFQIGEEKEKVISEIFYKQVLYVGYNESIIFKKDCIRDMQSPPMIEIGNGMGDTIVVKSVKDTFVREIKKNDYITALKEFGQSIGKEYTETDVDEVISGIASCAFANCGKLKNIYIPRSVREIGEYAFFGCYNLETIDLSQVRSIGKAAFMQCTALHLKGMKFAKRFSTIGDQAFMGCVSLDEIDFSESMVTEIGKNTFSDCHKLQKILYPADLQKIGRGAFQRCGNLERIEFPDSLEQIGEWAFKDCKIDHIDLPGGIKVVPRSAFNACSNLRVLKIAEGITELGDAAFSFCRRLEEVYLPKSLGNIGENVFSGCSSLKKIYYAGTMLDWNGKSEDKIVAKVYRKQNWADETPDYEIICSDRIVTKKESEQKDWPGKGSRQKHHPKAGKIDS